MPNPPSHSIAEILCALNQKINDVKAQQNDAAEQPLVDVLEEIVTAIQSSSEQATADAQAANRIADQSVVEARMANDRSWWANVWAVAALTIAGISAIVSAAISTFVAVVTVLNFLFN